MSNGIIRVARVVDGRVMNVECATQEWLDAQTDPDVTFIPYTPVEPAAIGDAFDPATETFISPDAVEEG